MEVVILKVKITAEELQNIKIWEDFKAKRRINDKDWDYIDYRSKSFIISSKELREYGWDIVLRRLK